MWPLRITTEIQDVYKRQAMKDVKDRSNIELL